MDMCNWQLNNSLSILCERLRSEKLLVASELENIQRLNEQIDEEQLLLAQLSWIVNRQQDILNRLVNSHPSVLPENSCLLNAQLDSADFIEAYQRIDAHHYSSLTSILNTLYKSPKSVAELLNASDQIVKESEESNEGFVSCIFSFLYGCCVFPNDERYLLEVLSYLIDMQLSSNSDPRRVLRKGNAAFCRLYRLFSEGLFIDIFLTAALHDPVMYVLSQDDIFLDIDPSKSAIRFPPEERRRRFGEDENSLSYLQRLSAHRKVIESKLIAISTRFVQGITEAMSCFPQSLSWLVKELYSTLIDRNKLTTEQGSMAQIVHRVLESSGESLNELFSKNTFDSHQCEQHLRRSFVANFSELNCFHAILRSSAIERITDTNIRRDIRNLIRRMPSRFDAPNSPQRNIDTKNESRMSPPISNKSDGNAQNSTLSPTSSRSNKLRTFADRVQTVAHKGQLRLRSQHSSQQDSNGSHPGAASNVEVLIFALGDNSEPLGLCSEEKFMESLRQPLSIRKHKTSDGASEKRTRFLDSESIGMSDRVTDAGSEDEEEGASLSSSIEGNAEDALEDDAEDVSSTLPDNFSDVGLISANVSGRGSPSISGPPSVSGRDTPQSSHTDAAVQQDTSNANANNTTRTRHHLHRSNMPNLPLSVRRENSEGLEDKFGKFGLPQQDNKHRYRDDTHSLVSDSWSTDVQPSDTEGIMTDTRHEAISNLPANIQQLLQPPNNDTNNTHQIPIVSEETAPSRPLSAVTNRMTNRLPTSTTANNNAATANIASNTTANQAGAASSSSLGILMNSEDRSDTWSVDAMASDSEADNMLVHNRNDDLLLINDDDSTDQRIDTASGTSGGDTPLLMSTQSETSLASGVISAATQSKHLNPSKNVTTDSLNEQIHRGNIDSSTNDPISNNSNRSHQQQAKKKVPPVDVSVFDEIPSNSALPPNVPSIGEVAANGNSRERLRRQSSGSSFYSKSDIDSEFSKDLNEDALSTLLAEYVPMSSSYNPTSNIMDLITTNANSHTTSTSPAASILARAGSFCNDDIDNQSISQQRDHSLSPINNTFPFNVTKQRKDVSEMDRVGELSQSNACCPHSSDVHNDTKLANSDEKSEDGDKSTSKNVDVNTNAISGGIQTAATANTSGFARKKINIFQGLQKVGESLKMRKGMAVSSLKQSLSQATTMNELASVDANSNPSMCVSNDKPNTFKRDTQQDITGRKRLTGSHSMGELGCLREKNESNEHTANAILDKYKGKHAIVIDYNNSPDNLERVSNQLHPAQQCISVLSSSSSLSYLPYYDANNVTQCRAFIDAKRKLRLVLSSIGSSSLPDLSNMTISEHSTVDYSLSSANQINKRGECNDAQYLKNFLQILLAESINGQEKTLSAQIREVLRCITVFSDKEIRKLLRTLKDEHRKRTAYVLYLQQSRLTLLQYRSYLEKLLNRVQREKSLTVECLVEVLVRFYLQQRDMYVRRFINDFQLLKAQDERTDAVERALTMLYERMPNEAMWKDADKEMLAYARKSVERSIMAQIHLIAFYPNGEADQCRDSVFHKSLRKLAQIITPDHAELRIPQRFHGECPWPSAQAEISIINAYKSPRDKIACVVRCCETIQNLIFLAPQRGTASADDITPLLVYILIQANPQALLSNIQYINGFYGNRLEGAEAYWEFGVENLEESSYVSCMNSALERNYQCFADGTVNTSILMSEMESDESGSRNVLLGTIDEHLVRMRDHIKVVLGKQRSKVYFSYFKEWLRGHKSQEEFNGLGLAMMPTDQKFVHSDFFVTMKKLCDMQHKEDNAVRIFDDNRLTKQQKDLNASAQGVSNDQAIKKPRLISDIEYVDTRQSTAIVPSIPTEYNAMMEGLSEVHPFSGWLPSKGQIKGRMLLAVWEHGIESITDDCINPLLVVIRVSFILSF
ncbi:unnamed protein product [Anisakis simplex]|uniref:Receptor-mediated endocytosis protein 6 (inferred by orthology to a C. elegans protein) n=1 Tax=Anisakis simplex TaxID=6269 RepID=A0A158PPR5_ANISI|nr:unnamed protein product [Anisakis simplex]